MTDVTKRVSYDIIVIGAGSGGLSVGLSMAKLGFKVLMAVKRDKDIGGECLNDGCIPSKALVHVSRIMHHAKLAAEFGLEVNGKVNVGKAMEYIYSKQEVIRKHENAAWLREHGVDVVLGEAMFSGMSEISVNNQKYFSNKIVLATGSIPRRLDVPGTAMVNYFDNENIFHINELPDRMLVIGGGPIGIEIAQAFNRLGSRVTVLERGHNILDHDDESLTEILLQRLKREGIEFIFGATLQKFTSGNEAQAQNENGELQVIKFDAVFVGIGRELVLEPLHLHLAGIDVKEHKIVVDNKLRTTNKNVFVCGDIAGDLQFSHAAEFHARILLNNFFSPLKKKLDNSHMSWVTFTDPELATFGQSARDLQAKRIDYRTITQDFTDDDRAITDNYQYARLILHTTKGGWFKKQKILGGSMIAPNAGELIQELILANVSQLSINAIFNKIYPYPVASRINQKLIMKLKQESLTDDLKKVLHLAFKIFS